MMTLRVSADPWALRGPFGRVKRPLKMKYIRFLSSGLTLTSPNLSLMDFPDDPAAIPRSKVIISDTTQDESSNEHIDPEI